jgi:hypothetical protein
MKYERINDLMTIIAREMEQMGYTGITIRHAKASTAYS